MDLLHSDVLFLNPAFRVFSSGTPTHQLVNTPNHKLRLNCIKVKLRNNALMKFVCLFTYRCVDITE